MEEHLHNRMARKSGRPRIIDQLAREQVAAPTPVAEPNKPLRMKCSTCGHIFPALVYRTRPDGTRIYRCDGCGYSHGLKEHELKRMLL